VKGKIALPNSGVAAPAGSAPREGEVIAVGPAAARPGAVPSPSRPWRGSNRPAVDRGALG